MSFIFITTIYWVPGMCQTLVKVINVSCYNNHLLNLSGFTQQRLFLTQVKLSVGHLRGRDGEQGLCSTQSQGPTLFPWSHLGPWNYSLSPLHPARNPGGSSFPTFISAGVYPCALWHTAAPNWKGAGEGDLSAYLGRRRWPDPGQQGQSAREADSL